MPILLFFIFFFHKFLKFLRIFLKKSLKMIDRLSILQSLVDTLANMIQNSRLIFAILIKPI